MFLTEKEHSWFLLSNLQSTEIMVVSILTAIIYVLYANLSAVADIILHSRYFMGRSSLYSQGADFVQTISIHFPGRQSAERVICEFCSSWRAAAVMRSTRSLRQWPASPYLDWLGRSAGAAACMCAGRVFAYSINHSIRRCLRKDGADHEILYIVQFFPFSVPSPPCRRYDASASRQGSRTRCSAETTRALRSPSARTVSRLSTALNNSRVCRMSGWITGSRFGSMSGVAARSSSQLDGGMALTRRNGGCSAIDWWRIRRYHIGLHFIGLRDCCHAFRHDFLQLIILYTMHQTTHVGAALLWKLTKRFRSCLLSSLLHGHGRYQNIFQVHGRHLKLSTDIQQKLVRVRRNYLYDDSCI